MSDALETASETGKARPFTAIHVRSHAARIAALDDPRKANQARIRLMERIINAIASGEALSPRRCCAAFKEAFPDARPS